MNKKFRRTLAGLTAFLMAFSATAIPQVADTIGISVSASAASTEDQTKATVGDFRYTLNSADNTASVARPNSRSLSGEITIPGTIEVGEKTYSVTSIGKNAFSACYDLTSITIPDSVTTIGYRAFSLCRSLTSITLPDSVTTIGDEAFYCCDGLTSIALPNSVTTIGNRAFYDCRGLISITLPENITTIPSGAFSQCEKLTNFIIPDSVTTIGGSAFWGCDGLTSITIPKKVENIGLRAFARCDLLTEIKVDEDNRHFSSDGSVLFNKEKTQLITYPTAKEGTSYTIPANVTSIGGDGFFGCSNLTSITIPESVISIEPSVFSGCRDLTEILVDANNKNYKSVEGVLLTADGKTLLAYPKGKTATTYEIPAGTKVIEEAAFFDCETLTSITIPDSVTTIGDDAFESCSGLTNITIPDSVTTIGDFAFSYCSGLTSITIPGSVTSIGSYAFDSCSGLTNITISDGVNTISEGAFISCSGLTSITIPGSVTKIGDEAFEYCTGLTSITIPASVTSIGYDAFFNCTGLTAISLPSRFKNDIDNLGLEDGVDITYTDESEATGNVTFNNNYISVAKSDGSTVENGTELDDGTELTITVTVPAGMKLNSVKANGETLTAGSDGTYKFTTSSGAAIVADFVAKEYTLAITDNENATIVVKDAEGKTLENGAVINYNDMFTVEVTPAVGYKTTAVNVEKATFDNENGYYIVNDNDDGATITVSATVGHKIFTLKKIPENVTLTKNDKETVTADANNTFKKGDKITIEPNPYYDLVIVPMVCGTEAIYNNGYAYYIFTGEEEEGEFYVQTEALKYFMIDLEKVPANTKLYGRMEVSGEKPTDYEVKSTTSFYKGYKLVIKIDEGYKVKGDVKVGGTVVTADANDEYVYTFTGDEDNSKPLVVSATAKKVSKIKSITESNEYVKVSVTKNGEEVKAGDEVLEGDELTIEVTTNYKSKLKRVVAGGTVLSANADGKYTFTVGTSDVTIEAEIAKPKSLIEVGYKDKYFAPVELDEFIKGLELIVTYDDGTVEYHVPVTKDMISDFKVTESNISFYLTYGTLKGPTTKPLTAVAVEKIAVTTDFKKEYKVGDELNITGGKITVYKNDGSTEEKDITADMVSGFDSSSANSNLKLTITYTDNGDSYTTDYYVVVIDSTKTVSKIEIAEAPTKTEYFVGEELVVDGKITATYDGEGAAPEVIEITEGMISGFDSSTAGTKTITVTYGGKTATYEITVKEIAVDSITLAPPPTKTNYMVGDSLDIIGGYIIVTYNNGKTKPLPFDTVGVSITGFDSSTVGTKTITVTYKEKTATFEVNVAEKSYKVNFSNATVKNGNTEITTGSSVPENATLTITAAEKSGYTIKSIVVNGKEFSGSTATVAIINDTTISVNYTKNSSSGGSSSGGGGRYTGGGSSSGGSGSSTPKNPTVDGKEQSWTDVAKDIEKLTDDKPQTIDLNGGKTVPADVIKAISVSDSNVTFNIDDVFSWTIDGSKMDEKDAQNANLAIVKRNVTGTSALRGSVGTGFAINNTNVKSELNINFKSTHAGKFANLFKKVGDKLVFVDNVKLDKDGKAIGLEVSTSGEYVVMLGDYSDRTGDMDNDGILNAKDALAVLKDYAKIETGKNPLVADINGDGFRNALDALMILKMAAGIL